MATVLRGWDWDQEWIKIWQWDTWTDPFSKIIYLVNVNSNLLKSSLEGYHKISLAIMDWMFSSQWICIGWPSNWKIRTKVRKPVFAATISKYTGGNSHITKDVMGNSPLFSSSSSTGQFPSNRKIPHYSGFPHL